MRKIHLTLIKDQYPNTIPVFADWFYKEPKIRSKKRGNWILDMQKDKDFYYSFFYRGKNPILEDANNGLDPLKVSVKNFDKFISLLKSLKFPFTIKEQREICNLDKNHEDYFVWKKIKVMDETTTCKVFPNKNKELHKKVFKQFNSTMEKK